MRSMWDGAFQEPFACTILRQRFHLIVSIHKLLKLLGIVDQAVFEIKSDNTLNFIESNLLQFLTAVQVTKMENLHGVRVVEGLGNLVLTDFLQVWDVVLASQSEKLGSLAAVLHDAVVEEIQEVFDGADAEVDDRQLTQTVLLHFRSEHCFEHRALHCENALMYFELLVPNFDHKVGHHSGG